MGWAGAVASRTANSAKSLGDIVEIVAQDAGASGRERYFSRASGLVPIAMKLAFALLTCVLAASAAGIDGQWNAELSARGKKAAAPAQNNSFTLNLKTQD